MDSKMVRRELCALYQRVVINMSLLVYCDNVTDPHWVFTQFYFNSFIHYVFAGSGSKLNKYESTVFDGIKCTVILNAFPFKHGISRGKDFSIFKHVIFKASYQYIMKQVCLNEITIYKHAEQFINHASLTTSYDGHISLQPLMLCFPGRGLALT